MSKLKDLAEYKGATKEEIEEAKEFYKEYYGISLKKPGENKHINDPEEVKAAHRRYNQLKTDAFDASQRKGELVDFNTAREFMEDASDDWDMRDHYKLFGFEETLKMIVERAERDVENKHTCTKTVLARLISQWDILRKMNEKAKREKRKHGK